jgi:hypothetical protein
MKNCLRTIFLGIQLDYWFGNLRFPKLAFLFCSKSEHVLIEAQKVTFISP